jgi:pimeloyl-ACP methyl ester carboxylesterase
MDDAQALVRERRFVADGTDLNYAEGPDNGPPLVLLHGGASHWQAFLPLIPALAAHHHVYAPDLRGHGRSAGRPGAYRLDDFAADILACLRECVGAPATVLGHSFGGKVAVLAAAQHSEQVRAVILADTPLALEPFRQRLIDGAEEAERHNRLSDHPHDPDFSRALSRDFDETFAAWKLDALLPALTCPVLILQADPAHGGALSDGEVSQALALLQDARLVRFPGASHGLWDDRLGDVVSAITTFCRDHGC